MNTYTILYRRRATKPGFYLRMLVQALSIFEAQAAFYEQVNDLASVTELRLHHGQV
jgi:hypothetical protein